MTQEEFHKRYQYNPSTDCLGEGGFGKVFKAYDTHRDRYVAVKMSEVKPQLAGVRLKKEVDLISKLPTHPNIAYYEECYSFSTFAGEYDFGVLQYYEEGNLEQVAKTTPLTLEQKDALLRQILNGVSFLHEQGIIHRDLKPQNILIVKRNGELIPKITDFGISKQLDGANSSAYTNSLSGAGTLTFASPEQLCGLEIRKNTDLWSFGVIVSWLFTSKLPFASNTHIPANEGERIELYKKITGGELNDTISHLPSRWADLVVKCLIVDNNKRIADVSACVKIIDGKEIPALDDYTVIVGEKEKSKHQNKKRGIIKFNPFKGIWSFWVNRKKTVLASIFMIVFIFGSYIHWEYKYNYYDARDFSEGLAAINKLDKWGFIDTTGNVVISRKFNDIGSSGGFHEGFACVLFENKWIFINKAGENAFPNCKYQFYKYSKFENGYVEVVGGYLDKNGCFRDKCELINVDPFEKGPMFVSYLLGRWDNYYNVWIDNSWSCYKDKMGKIIYKGYGLPFSEGLAAVRSDDNSRWYFINTNGKIVIPFGYSAVQSFSEGKAAVAINKNWGYIDKKGNEIIPFTFESAGPFKNNRALVKENGRLRYIYDNGSSLGWFGLIVSLFK